MSAPEPSTGTIYLRSDTRGEGEVSLEPPRRSLEWAGTVQPYSWFLLALYAALVLIPFALIGLGLTTSKSDLVFQWASVVFPPTVGFLGALIGYYYGNRPN